MAVLHVTQGIELLLKARLVDVHPILMKTNIDNPTSDHTVSPEAAIKRLATVGFPLKPADARRVLAAVKVRNSFMHYEVDADIRKVRSLYVNLFEFAHHFSSECGDDLHGRLPVALHLTEAELLQEFRSEWVMYNGQDVVARYPIELVESQLFLYVIVGSEQYERIPCGDADDLMDLGGRPCPNCAALPGRFHVFLCTKESCPACRGQAFSCSCDWEYGSNLEDISSGE